MPTGASSGGSSGPGVASLNKQQLCNFFNLKTCPVNYSDAILISKSEFKLIREYINSDQIIFSLTVWAMYDFSRVCSVIKKGHLIK